jgi:hypothetical protein
MQVLTIERKLICAKWFKQDKIDQKNRYHNAKIGVFLQNQLQSSLIQVNNVIFLVHSISTIVAIDIQT